MSSSYSFEDDGWWVSNGSAGVLDGGWARHLRARGHDALPELAPLLEELDWKAEDPPSGMAGLHFDLPPCTSAVVRRTLIVAVEDLARDFAEACRGQVVHPDLAFFPTLEPTYVVHWMASHVAIHEMLRRALGDTAPAPLMLEVAPALMAAARGSALGERITRLERVRTHPERGGVADPEREAILRRQQCTHWLQADPWITRERLRASLEALAKLGAALGDREHATWATARIGEL